MSSDIFLYVLLLSLYAIYTKHSLSTKVAILIMIVHDKLFLK